MPHAPLAAAREIRVWDPWVRLVHWSIVLLLPFSYWTAETDRWEWHFYSGYAIMTLVLFRIAWGLVGSDTARFGNFLRSPREAIAHLRHLRTPPREAEIGHNAAGGWMVLALLLLLLAQASAGLFADDLILTRGPLARWAGEAVSDRATAIHLRVFWVIVGAAVLHILAIIAYRVLRGQNLVRAMISGRQRVAAGDPAATPRMASPVLALALLAIAALAVWGVTRLG
jgi:cytochrome b